MRAVLVWVLTRASAFVLLGYGTEQSNLGDVRRYRQWSYDLWHHGQLPHSWEYPIGAVSVLVPVPGSRDSYVAYLVVFAGLLLAADAAIAAQLRSSRTALWAWVLMLPLLGPLVWTRFDLLPALACVLALRTSGAGRGLATAAGALVKLWPLVVLPATRDLRATVVAVATLAMTAVTVLALGGAHLLLSPLRYQSDRGLQVESLLATPYLPRIDRHGPTYAHGAWELVGVPAHALGLIGTVVAGLVAIALLARGGEAAWLTTMTVMVVLLGDKALSPQYLVWVLAPLCVAIARGSVSTRPLWPMGVALGLTHLVYPLTYQGLLNGNAFSAGLLTARNAALVWLAVSLFRSREVS